MSKPLHWVIFALLISTQLSANQLFSLQQDKEGKEFTNQLSEHNAADGTVKKAITLSPTWKRDMMRLLLPPSDHLFFYGMIDGKQARIQMVDKSDISQIKTIDTAHLHERLINNERLYQFFHLTADQKHLLVHVGKKKNQQLLVIDVQQGVIAKAIALSKFKNEVSVSSDQQYLLVNNTSRDELTVLRMSDFSVALTSKLGDYRQFGTIHQDHLYLTKQSGQKPKAQHWVQAIDLNSHEKVSFPARSQVTPVFATSEQTGRLFTVAADERGKNIVLSELTGTSIKPIKTYPVKRIDLQEMIVMDDYQQILVKGFDKLVLINLTDDYPHTYTKLPFDTADYAYNTRGDLLYLREGSGSEVAVVDVANGELIERSGTGRPGVKFGQFLGTVVLAGATGFGLNYMQIVYKRSSTGMILNHQENNLYVINWKTNDVTRFTAADLSNREAIATGGGTGLLYQSDDAQAPVWVFSGKQITQINDADFTVTQAIEYESLVGFDGEQDFFIIKTEDEVQTHDMKTGQIISRWPMTKAHLIWSE
ncbi:hypothetical protein [Marinicella meishanensis]|uniref:hypothetical protein n=1 Tax=Marinicella meishanensis TaxID=2873263 RepID=UPI001CBD2D2A|nr:hypothetical protein [Marinicella sp. NBU2979]